MYHSTRIEIVLDFLFQEIRVVWLLSEWACRLFLHWLGTNLTKSSNTVDESYLMHNLWPNTGEEKTWHINTATSIISKCPRKTSVFWGVSTFNVERVAVVRTISGQKKCRSQGSKQATPLQHKTTISIFYSVFIRYQLRLKQKLKTVFYISTCSYFYVSNQKHCMNKSVFFIETSSKVTDWRWLAQYAFLW